MKIGYSKPVFHHRNFLRFAILQNFWHTSWIVREFKLAPLIFPRKNHNFKKLFNMLRYPLKIFDLRRNTEKKTKFYKEIVAKFRELISKWKEFRSVRSIIEDIFKLARKAYSMEDLHRYTRSSVQKYCSLAVLLVGTTIITALKKERNYKPSLNKEIKRELLILV